MKKALLCLSLAVMFVYVGCPGSSTTPPSIFHTWQIASLTIGGTQFQNMSMTLNSDGTYSSSYTQLQGTWQAGSNSGTFTPSSAPANTEITLTVVSASGLNPGIGNHIYIKYDNLTDTTVQFYINATGSYEGPSTWQRQ
jgi:hypothetical protein